MNSKYFPERLFIDSEVVNYPLTERIIGNLPSVKYEIIKDSKAIIRKFNFNNDYIKKGKKHLLITKFKGKFVKPCPGTPRYLCCNYYIINSVLNCPLDCTYCILQHYLDNPFITIYANMDDLFDELNNFLSKNKNRLIRIGTGELSDSLAIDHFTHLSKELVLFFAERQNVVFELKTKTTNIDNLLEINHKGKTVVSWSLNSNKIVEFEEFNTSTNRERFESAKKVVSSGYKIGFHFDPIVFYPNWEEDYHEIIRDLFMNFSSSEIAWISLGTLRFPPGLKKIIQNRFPKTKIIYNEFILGLDGKFRYFKPIRLQIYKKIVQWIKNYSRNNVFIYFCMESKDIWRKILKWQPKSQQDINDKLCKIVLAKSDINK